MFFLKRVHGGNQGSIVSRRQRTPAGAAAVVGQQFRQSVPVDAAEQVVEDMALPVAGSMKSLSRYITVRMNPAEYDPSTCALPLGKMVLVLVNRAEISSVAIDAVLQ